MNKVILTGRLVKDGELRTTDGDKSKYVNTIAVKREFANKDGNYDSDFILFQCWNVSDKLQKYLKKGTSVEITARVQTRTYDTQEGEKKFVTEIIAEHIGLLSINKASEKDTKEQTLEDIGVPDNYKTEYEEKEPSVHLEDSDLPF